MRRAPDRIGIAQMVDPRVALDAEHALKQHAERVVERRGRAGAITAVSTAREQRRECAQGDFLPVPKIVSVFVTLLVSWVGH